LTPSGGLQKKEKKEEKKRGDPGGVVQEVRRSVRWEGKRKEEGKKYRWTPGGGRGREGEGGKKRKEKEKESAGQRAGRRRQGERGRGGKGGEERKPNALVLPESPTTKGEKGKRNWPDRVVTLPSELEGVREEKGENFSVGRRSFPVYNTNPPRIKGRRRGRGPVLLSLFSPGEREEGEKREDETRFLNSFLHRSSKGEATGEERSKEKKKSTAISRSSLSLLLLLSVRGNKKEKGKREGEKKRDGDFRPLISKSCRSFDRAHEMGSRKRKGEEEPTTISLLTSFISPKKKRDQRMDGGEEEEEEKKSSYFLLILQATWGGEGEEKGKEGGTGALRQLAAELQLKGEYSKKREGGKRGKCPTCFLPSTFTSGQRKRERRRVLK